MCVIVKSSDCGHSSRKCLQSVAHVDELLPLIYWGKVVGNNKQTRKHEVGCHGWLLFSADKKDDLSVTFSASMQL